MSAHSRRRFSCLPRTCRPILPRRGRDAPPDKPSDKPAGGAAATSEPKGQELTYAARISLDRTQMQIEDKMVNLTPGMAVTAEIKTGSRRIITYLLSPLLKYKQESLRER